MPAVAADKGSHMTAPVRLILFDDVAAPVADAVRPYPRFEPLDASSTSPDATAGGGAVGVLAGARHAADAYRLSAGLASAMCLFLLDAGRPPPALPGRAVPNLRITALSTAPAGSPSTAELVAWRRLTVGRFEVRLLPPHPRAAGRVAVLHVQDGLRLWRTGQAITSVLAGGT
jgi:hypothetical protein